MERLNLNIKKNMVVSILLLSVIVLGGLLISSFIGKDNNTDIHVAITDSEEPQVKIEENEVNENEGASEVEVPKIDEKESTINPKIRAIEPLRECSCKRISARSSNCH